MTDSYLVDYVVDAFTQADRQPDQELRITSGALEFVRTYRYGRDADRIWSMACQEYDRRMMTPDEYAEQYGGDE